MGKEDRKNPWLEPFKSLLQKLMKTGPIAIKGQDDIAAIREWIYKLSSWMFRYPGGVVLLFRAWNFYLERHPGVAFFEVLIYLSFWLSHYIFKDKAVSRYLTFSLLLYTFSIVHILYAGKDGTGFLLVLVTFLLSGSLLPTRINGLMLSMNALVFLGLTAGQFLGAFQGIHMGDYGIQWIFHVLVLLLAIYVQYFMIRVFFTQFLSLISRYDLAISGTDDGIWDWDLTTGTFYISNRWKEQLGYEPHELEPAFDTAIGLIIPEDREQAESTLQAYLRGETDHYKQIFRMRHKDGSIRFIEAKGAAVRDADGQVLRMAGSHTDITSRHNQEEQILYLSQHDTLTGLLNINALRKGLLREELREGYAILFLDIDNFRLVNESLGSEGGDQVLKELAQKLQEALGDKGTLYRNEGDEFVAILGTRDGEAAERIARALQQAVILPLKMVGRIFYLSASVGVELGDASTPPATALKHADTALYVAKRQRNKIVFYSQEMEGVRTREKILEADFAQALEAGEFWLAYQPIVDIRRGRLVQGEALLRWNHPELGLISPGEFIVLAERCKFIIPLTAWVLEEACRQLARWEAQGLKDLIISVNISILCLEGREELFLEELQSILGRHQVAPERLTLEITETTLMSQAENWVPFLQRLKETGIRLALDDFGTGFSSFGYLKDLPLDEIKLDRSLISHVEEDFRECFLASSMATIIHGLGLEMIVEGIETEEQFRAILKTSCDAIQGYYFSRPLNPEAFFSYWQEMEASGELPRYILPAQLPAPMELQWREDWESGEPEIDMEHRNILARAMSIVNDATAHDRAESVERDVHALVKEIKEHFTDEESLLDAWGYPDLPAHREEHRRLEEECLALEEGYREGTVRPTDFFQFILNEVALKHMEEEDRKFFPFIRELMADGKARESLDIQYRPKGPMDYRSRLEEALQLQAVQSRISAIFLEAQGVRGFDEKVQEALEVCGKYVHGDRVYIFRYDWEKETCSNTYEWCREGITPEIENNQDFPISAIGPWTEAHRKGKTICISDIGQLPPDDEIRKIMEPQGIQSIMTLPMMKGEECYGFVGLDSVASRHLYTDYEQKVLKEIAKIFLLALEGQEAAIKLQKEERLSGAAMISLKEGIIAFDSDGLILMMNPAAEELTGTSYEKARGRSWEILGMLQNQEGELLLQEGASLGEAFLLPLGTQLKRQDGTVLRVQGRISPFEGEGEERYIATFWDQSQETRLQEEAQAFLDLNLDILAVADTQGRFLKVNRRMEEILGYPGTELEGQDFFRLIHPDDRENTANLLKDLEKPQTIRGFSNRYRTWDGRYRHLEWVARGSGDGYIYASARDVTEEIEKRQKMEYLSYHDSLTDLYNRRYIEEALERWSGDRRQYPLTVIMGDINKLKETNDTKGHGAGDRLIREVARAIRSSLRPEDLVGRWGGDEFLILLPRTGEEEGRKILTRIQEAAPGQEDGGLSMGLYSAAAPGPAPDELLKHADEEMYKMKQHRQEDH